MNFYIPNSQEKRNKNKVRIMLKKMKNSIRCYLTLTDNWYFTLVLHFCFISLLTHVRKFCFLIFGFVNIYLCRKCFYFPVFQEDCFLKVIAYNLFCSYMFVKLLEKNSKPNESYKFYYLLKIL